MKAAAPWYAVSGRQKTPAGLPPVATSLVGHRVSREAEVFLAAFVLGFDGSQSKDVTAHERQHFRAATFAFSDPEPHPLPL